MPVASGLIRHLLFPAHLALTGRLRVLRCLREFERSQFWEPEKLRRLQLRRLLRLLQHAYDNCPFYRWRFDDAGVHPRDVRQLEDVEALPLLSRRDLQRHRSELIATNWPHGDLVPNQTGGSTGEPVSFFVSNERMDSRQAATLRHNRWAGLDVADKSAYLWGASGDRPRRWHTLLRQQLIDRQLFLDASSLSEELLRAYHARLKDYRPKVIVAYARVALLFAQFARSACICPYRPRAIITSAEVLTGEERHVIEETFGCPVFNRYGCREVSVIASECDRHEGLHTMAEGLLVEIVRPDGRTVTEPGETGAIVITDLVNYAMPLIRYRIGDVGSWQAGECACGRGLPRLRQVAGRATDFLVATDGRLVSGAFLTIAVAAQRTSLGQIQVIQDAPGRVRFRIRPGPGFRADDDLSYLADATSRLLGDAMRFEWELVERIDPEPSGKYVFSRCRVACTEYTSHVTSENDD
jgi:phenylacetate-CoA ligase